MNPNNQDTTSTDIDRQIDEFVDDIRYNTEIPFDERLTSAKASLKFLVAQQTVAARLEEREASQKMWRREHDYWKNVAEQFIKREQMRVDPPKIVLPLSERMKLEATELQSLKTPPQGKEK